MQTCTRSMSSTVEKRSIPFFYSIFFLFSTIPTLIPATDPSCWKIAFPRNPVPASDQNSCINLPYEHKVIIIQANPSVPEPSKFGENQTSGCIGSEFLLCILLILERRQHFGIQ